MPNVGAGNAKPSCVPPAQLSRDLRLRHLIVYGMIFVVPIAPMAVYGFVARLSFGMVPLVYVVGVVAMIFTAMSYVQMSREFSSAGSVYFYVGKGLNPYFGFVAGWMVLADYILVPALGCVLSASWLGGIAPGVPMFAWILLFVAINTAINVLGIKFQARSNFLLLLVELACLAAFVIIALYYVLIQRHGAGSLSIAPFYNPQHMNLQFLAGATTVAALSFLGFDGISTLSEEATNPERDVGRATIIVLLIMGAIFIIETYVATLAHPDYKTLSESNAFFEIGKEVGGSVFYVALIVVNVIAAGIANALAAQSAISRILYSMGRDGVLPMSGFLSRINARFKTPVNAILSVAVISVIVSLLFSPEALVKLVNFGALSAFMLLNAAVFVYFYLVKKRYAKVMRYCVAPIVGFCIIAFVWHGFDRDTFLFGGSWLVLGLILGFFKRNKIGAFDTMWGH